MLACWIRVDLFVRGPMTRIDGVFFWSKLHSTESLESIDRDLRRRIL